jgi:hypothetical protein
VSSSIRQDIQDSIDDIYDLLVQYGDLFTIVRERDPSKIELAALGAVLHSFYNGIEGLFLLVSKQIDCNDPIGLSWHQVLLNKMTEATPNRCALISSETAECCD